jgi:predicted TIM-barrel fold metal-dependent hydrolase
MAAITDTGAAKEVKPGAKRLVIDCDIHEDLRSIEQVRPYLADEFQSFLRQNLRGNNYIGAFEGSVRRDAIRPDGTVESAYLDGIQSAHLDPHGITYGVLTGLWNIRLSMMPQQYLAAGLASAYNDWLIDEMLSSDPRLKGSITVAPQLPKLAAREIDRVGQHPAMVQVCLSTGSPDLPWGHEFFDPIWEACVRNGLRVGMHVSGGGGLTGPGNGAGWPRTYMEWRSQFPNVFEAQLISMVVNGVFEKFPELGVVFIEGGFAWLPGVLWRLDQSWRSLRAETPWLKRLPSAYVHEHVRLSTQPFEEPPDPKHLLYLIDMMGSDKLLMFATDFPHWDFDSPDRALPRILGEDLRRKILWDNASEFYGLSEPKG